MEDKEKVVGDKAEDKVGSRSPRTKWGETLQKAR